MKLNNVVRKVATVTSVAGLMVAGVFAVPAAHAARSTVVIHETNAFTSLNTGTPDTNLTTNTDIAYMTGMGFNYYDDKKNLVANTVLGSYKVIKNKSNDFRVQWTVNPGRVWSDGTPIDARDMLIGHVLSSSAYSKAAGLGDPNDEKNPPAFNSLGYGGTYDSHIVGLPTISADGMSVTLKFDAPVPNWELYGPGISPAYTYLELANGLKGLQSVADNNKAKDAVVKAIQTKDTATLKKIAKVWNEAYNITTIDSSTNPLLLVSNGAYLVNSAVKDQSVTLKPNPKYNSGPKTTGSIDTVVFRFIADGTAAAQALANGELDMYQGQATADAVTQLKAMKGVTVLGGTNACYEHVDLRTAANQGTKDVYTGPFAASSPNGKALRQAFLLAYPRQEIMDKIVKPINATANLMNSLLVFPKEPGYADMVAKNGSSKFTSGTQDDRTAQALALVKKYYPDASATNGAVKVRLLWGQPTNARRAAEAALVKAALAKAGFDVNTTPTSGWSRYLADTKYDAMFFAWVKSAITQKGNADLFCTKCDNNSLGYSNATVDKLVEERGEDVVFFDGRNAYEAKIGRASCRERV